MAEIGKQAEPTRQSQVQEYLARAEKAAEELRGVIGTLEDRVSSVLRVDPPTPEVPKDKSGRAMETLCPTADRLRSLLDTIQGISTHVQNISAHIEA